ncbi:MAG: HAMP domain-containing sensor histidine kinase [Acutalibacteraceae bacterium]|nr:HAMP domain-containing sensor histidine kinase [Acutalibacteraceae bacterium]
MKKSLFKKYLSVTSIIIVVSFLFLGTVMIVFIARYFQSEKQAQLTQNAKSMASIAGQSVVMMQDNQYLLDGSRMALFIKAFSDNVDADFFLVDQSGAEMLSTYSIEEDENPNADIKSRQNISAETMHQALSGYFSATGTMNGLYESNYYIIGVPIVTTNSSGQQVAIGAVFAASDLKVLDVFRSETIKMFLLAAIAAFMVSFCIVWTFSYKLAKPLREMAIAAKHFGEGDFSVRVPVGSQDEIGELSSAFNQMAETLAAGESMRRNFIANTSHELKTPMTTIAGFVDGILDGTIPEEKRNHYLKIVSQEVKRLSRLVKTMLDLSKIDSGEMKLRLTRFDLSNTIFVTLLSFEKAIEDKKIEIRGLETASSLFVDGDPDMIHQVLYNLLENAVKFTNVGGYIDIRLAETNDRVTVTIKNSGPGIPADEVAMIFDRFYKTDKSRSQDKNGMGLGLYIVRTIIRLHGGDICVSSVENEFCQFEFCLPKKIKETNCDKGKDNKEQKDTKWSNPLKNDNKQTKTEKKAKKKEEDSTPEVIEVTDVEIVEKPKDDDAALH